MRINEVSINASEAYLKVMRWFFSFPERKIGLSDLVSEVGISKTTANRIILKLEKEGFLVKEVIGKAWRVNCNQSHVYNKTKKIAYNLEMVYESEIVEEIDKKYHPKSVILFGGYRKGDDNEKSDIDIAVEVVSNTKMKIEEFWIVEKFGFRKNVKVNVHVFSRKNVDKHLFSNIVNGIVLEGFLEIK